ncbi:Crp/Fnr family transcriptional regulator [Microvirga sp. M2]|uniref:Crp/Fnr family transcriptional regulator n=1 Tax=Microvirga sp. M2 TaxID=3073270 RepID=UPI0039C09A61
MRETGKRPMRAGDVGAWAPVPGLQTLERSLTFFAAEHRLCMKPVRLATNQALFSAGEACHSLYLLASGLVRVFDTLADGRRHITDFARPGDLLPMLDEGAYWQNAEAVVPSRAYAVSRQHFRELVERHPSLACQLNGMIRASLHAANRRQVLLGCLSALERVACFLIMAARHSAGRGGPGNTVELLMSRYDIADYLGLTVETVSRTLTRLKQHGQIRLPTPQEIEIVDKAGLMRLAGLPGIAGAAHRQHLS